MEERRKYPRLKSHLVAGFRRIESFDEYKTDLTENISMAGFMIDVEYPAPSFVMGRAMEINIRDPREKDDPIKGIGRMVWMREKEDRSGCEIGIMITHIKAEDRARYMQHFLEINPA